MFFGDSPNPIVAVIGNSRSGKSFFVDRTLFGKIRSQTAKNILQYGANELSYPGGPTFREISGAHMIDSFMDSFLFNLKGSSVVYIVVDISQMSKDFSVTDNLNTWKMRVKTIDETLPLVVVATNADKGEYSQEKKQYYQKLKQKREKSQKKKEELENAISDAQNQNRQLQPSRNEETLSDESVLGPLHIEISDLHKKIEFIDTTLRQRQLIANREVELRALIANPKSGFRCVCMTGSADPNYPTRQLGLTAKDDRLTPVLVPIPDPSDKKDLSRESGSQPRDSEGDESILSRSDTSGTIYSLIDGGAEDQQNPFLNLKNKVTEQTQRLEKKWALFACFSCLLSFHLYKSPEAKKDAVSTAWALFNGSYNSTNTTNDEKLAKLSELEKGLKTRSTLGWSWLFPPKSYTPEIKTAITQIKTELTKK